MLVRLSLQFAGHSIIPRDVQSPAGFGEVALDLGFSYARSPKSPGVRCIFAAGKGSLNSVLAEFGVQAGNVSLTTTTNYKAGSDFKRFTKDWIPGKPPQRGPQLPGMTRNVVCWVFVSGIPFTILPFHGV